MELHVLNHPLVEHKKLTVLRDKNTPSSTFRELVSELVMLEDLGPPATCPWWPRRSRRRVAPMTRQARLPAPDHRAGAARWQACSTA